MAERIFVSYSHHDAALVTPVVRLLRSTNDFVFQDSDSIKPGSRWRGALADALREANLVVIFWCLHANESSEVESEYRAAIDAAKNILPVLLDSTPVPPALGEFQWVDFRQLVQHGRLESAAPAAVAPSFRRRSSWLTAAAGLAVLVVALSVLILSGRRPADVPSDQTGNSPAVQPVEPMPTEIPPDVVPQPADGPITGAAGEAAPPIVDTYTALSDYVPWLIPFVVVVVLVLVGRILRTASPPSVPLLPDPETAQAAMATSLAREIYLRLTPERK